MATALIVDDEKDICELIKMGLSGQDIVCDMAHSVKAGIKMLKSTSYDFMICDVRLPDGDGLDLLAHAMKYYPAMPVCMITAHGSMDMAIRALRLGAFDFINKPFDLKQLRSVASQALKERVSSRPNAEKVPSNKNPKTAQKVSAQPTLIGQTQAMQTVRVMIEKVARSQAPVFINGESGTGKEIVARSIHEQSARREGAFVAVNCGAIPENLVESEFFGYKKGAFTGANQDQDGLFVAANGGTLFLDEVADLPLSMQVKLLRAIQERAVRPIGGDKEIGVDIRIISATHHDLEKQVADKLFRQDLYYRLNVISLSLPPLRERIEDIPLLTKHLLKRLSSQGDYEHVSITEQALAKLQQYGYPGNVRELENILERALTFSDSNCIEDTDIILKESILNQQFQANNTTTTASHEHASAQVVEADKQAFSQMATHDIPAGSNETSLPNDLDEYMQSMEKELLIKALKDCDQNKTKAAEKLGISFRAIRYKLKKFGIE